MDLVHTRTQKYKEQGSISPHMKAILYTTRRYLLLSTFFKFTSDASSIAMSVLANKLITSIEHIYHTGQGHGVAVGYALGSLALLVIGFTTMLWAGYLGDRLDEYIRNIVTTSIYEKTMRLSPYGRAQYDAAAITSLVTVDTAKVAAAAHWSLIPITSIPLLGAVVGILIYFLGVYALVVFGLIAIGLSSAALNTKTISDLMEKSLEFADKRISIIRETITAMRTLKLYGWEQPFVKIIESARKLEEKYVFLASATYICTFSMTETFPFFAGMLTFAVMTIKGRALSPATAFPALSLFNFIAPISQAISESLYLIADAYPCVLRIEQFLDADEMASAFERTSETKEAVLMENYTAKWVKNIPQDDKITLMHRLKAVAGVKMRRKTYKVEEVLRKDTSSSAGLEEANLRVQKGDFVVVVGSIGSGKSNLLNAISGNMVRFNGSLKVDGAVTSVLNSWCMNATVKDNILFGQRYDEKRYREVIRVCELTRDLQIFEHGDMTEVGEHGITLSGGQKARLALARGVYRGGDIFLLDDVLSAVDSKVGRNIMRNCIMGFLSSSTKIMSTHNPVHLQFADKVVFMVDGEIKMGTLEELKEDPTFVDFIKSTEDVDDGPKDSEVTAENENKEAKVHEAAVESEKLMTEETRTRGGMSFSVITTYIKSSGKHYLMDTAIIFGFLLLVGASFAMISVFLNWWTSDRFSQPKGFYIGIYAAIVSIYGLSSLGFLIYIAKVVYRATSNSLNAALRNAYRAPLSFFDTNPIGRVINRFTNDISLLDTKFFYELSFLMPVLASLLAQYVLIFVYVPWAILCVIPLVFVGMVAQTFYRYSSREINRIHSLFRGRQMGSITENIDGFRVIVGYEQAESFRRRVYESTNKTISATIMNQGTIYWFASRTLLAFLPTYLVVVMLCIFQVFKINVSSVAMLIGILPNACLIFIHFMLLSVEVEKNFNSVERLHEYTYKLPQEGLQEIPDASLPENWPTSGHITFEHVAMRYREGLPLVLKNTSFTACPGEKIGVCGRTGAGKSSLISCLFRLNELETGKITVNGVDISTIGLKDLRNKLSIIPQDSILFQGTVRSNLDPFGAYSDAELEDTIKRSGASYDLNAPVEANGANFSLGERQLLTLSRALVKRSKVIALDEATANVDQKTDEAIQQVLANEFSDSTVICIAHRLQTIINYDRIIVMEAGRVAEVGTPTELWKFNGMFAALCREAGIDLTRS